MITICNSELVPRTYRPSLSFVTACVPFPLWQGNTSLIEPLELKSQRAVLSARLSLPVMRLTRDALASFAACCFADGFNTRPVRDVFFGASMLDEVTTPDSAIGVVSLPFWVESSLQSLDRSVG